MGLTDDAFDAFDAAVSADPAAREVVAHLAEPLAATPPAGVRDAVVQAAAGARPFGSSAALPGGGAPPVDVYAGAVERLAATLTTLGDTDWRRPAAPYPWTVHGLAAHLLGVEGHTAEILGVPGVVPPVPAAEALDHIRFARELIARTVEGGDPGATVAAWRSSAAAVVDHLRAGAVDLDAGVVFHTYPMSARSLLLVRSFELWTHDDDIRRAVGRPPSEPAPADFRTMADLAVNWLPVMLVLAGQADLSGRAHVVLTGDGGGTWDVAFGPDGERDDAPEVTLVADVIDWCRLTSQRLAPEDLALAVEGDTHLAAPILTAAQALAL